MGEYYIPFQVANDSIDSADDLSESISNGYGHWVARLPNIVHVNLDGITKTTRLTSIHYDVGNRMPEGAWNPDYGKIGFYFGAAFDMSNMTVFGFDWLAYDKASANIFEAKCLSGTSTVYLEDSAGAHAWVSFTHTTNNNQPSQFQTVRLNKEEFSTDFNFNWTKVQAWIFVAGGGANVIVVTGGYDIWIDKGPFAVISTTNPTITITCEDTQGNAIYGKSSQWSLTGGISNPETLPIINNPVGIGEYTIRILDNDFVKWVFPNGTESTDVSVTFTLTSGETWKATTVFSGGNGGGDGGDGAQPDWTLIAVASGVLVAGSIGAYYLLKGK